LRERPGAATPWAVIRPLRRDKLLCALLALTISGCGTSFYVTTEPRQAELWVDGRFVGIGSATVPTNGIVFNSYLVEARDKQGNVLNSAEVDIEFGPRSAVCAGVGLVGIIIWPLLPLIPAAFFVGEPDPERLHLRVPLEEQPPPPPVVGDEIDRPVIEFVEPAQGQQIATSSEVTVSGRVRHWSGVDTIEVALDGKIAQRFQAAKIDVERTFDTHLTIEAAGSHVIKVTAKGIRGAPAVEEVRITRILDKK
jgi:hypothetical protein